MTLYTCMCTRLYRYSSSNWKKEKSRESRDRQEEESKPEESGQGAPEEKTETSKKHSTMLASIRAELSY